MGKTNKHTKKKDINQMDYFPSATDKLFEMFSMERLTDDIPPDYAPRKVKLFSKGIIIAFSAMLVGIYIIVICNIFSSVNKDEKPISQSRPINSNALSISTTASTYETTRNSVKVTDRFTQFTNDKLNECDNVREIIKHNEEFCYIRLYKATTQDEETTSLLAFAKIFIYDYSKYENYISEISTIAQKYKSSYDCERCDIYVANSSGNIIVEILDGVYQWKDSAYKNNYISTEKTTATTTAKTTVTTTSSTTQPPVETAEPEEIEIELISLTSSVSRNETATISIKGSPNTQYDIDVYYSSGKSKAKGLEDKVSNNNGIVSWSWKVGGKTNSGKYKISIYGGGQSFSTYFTVN